MEEKKTERCKDSRHWHWWSRGSESSVGLWEGMPRVVRGKSGVGRVSQLAGSCISRSPVCPYKQGEMEPWECLTNQAPWTRVGNVSSVGGEGWITYAHNIIFKWRRRDVAHSREVVFLLLWQNRREEKQDFLWLTVSERLVHAPAVVGVWGGWAHCSQEVERGKWWCSAGFLLSSFWLISTQPIGGCHSYLGRVLSSGSLEIPLCMRLLSFLLLWWNSSTKNNLGEERVNFIAHL